EGRQPLLWQRGFPEPDPTTGLYCVEAVDKWRLLRYPHLFPELTAAPGAAHAETVFDDRMRRLNGWGQNPVLRCHQTARLLATSPAHARSRVSNHSLRP